MSACKFCGLEIEWRNDGGRAVPFNPDGTLHKPTCEAARAATLKENKRWTDILLEREQYGLSELNKVGAQGGLKSKEEISAYWAGYAAASRNAIGKSLRQAGEQG